LWSPPAHSLESYLKGMIEWNVTERQISVTGGTEIKNPFGNKRGRRACQWYLQGLKLEENP
jgi:hypothetical protein